MILESLPFILSFSPSLQCRCLPQFPSQQMGLASFFFYDFLTDPAAHNYSQFCLISQIKKIRLFVKEMYAAPLN